MAHDTSVVVRFLRCSAIYYEKGHKCSGFFVCLLVCELAAGWPTQHETLFGSLKY